MEVLPITDGIIVRALLQTELELAPTKERRAEIHENRIKNYQFLEKITLEKFDAGTADGAAKQLATANRIQAQIDSLRDAANPKWATRRTLMNARQHRRP